MPYVVVAALTLPLGFLVAEVTGERALGGLALVAGLAAGLMLARRARVPPPRRAFVVVVALLAFAAAHPLGRAVGSPIAVSAAGLAVGVVAAAVRPRRPVGGVRDPSRAH